MSQACLYTADDDVRALCLLQLREDPQYRRIAHNRRIELVEAALDDGRALADTAQQRWGREPLAMAASCNVPVTFSERDANYGSVTLYAEYVSGPPSITLYVRAIRLLDEVIAGSTEHLCSGITSSMPIFLAHELYHHLDCMRGEARLSKQHRVPIFQVGRWVWTSGLSSLAEIAAGAFAQRLLELSFHPGIFDLLVRNPHGVTTNVLEHA